jgi:aminoglycoside phosphotransferase (APT) family kinase protein
MQAPDLHRGIDQVNARHGTRWEIVERLAGGYSDAGAHLLREGERRAVLKLSGPGRMEARLAATAQLIDDAIRSGWRTPRWYAWGVLPNGEWYVVREFIAGRVPKTFEEADADAVLATNRRQAGLRPAIDADWSLYVRRTVVEATSTHAPRLRKRADTSTLLERLLAIVAAAGTVELPTDDLVHGDCAFENVVMSDGDAYLIDAEYAGKGTRAYDLATLLVHAATNDPPASAEVIERLSRECVAIAGRSAAIACVATRIMGLVDFGLDHWSKDVPSFIARSDAFVRELVGA